MAGCSDKSMKPRVLDWAGAARSGGVNCKIAALGWQISVKFSLGTCSTLSRSAAADSAAALSKLDYPSIVVNYFIISIVMNNFGFLYKLQIDRMVHSDNNVKKQNYSLQLRWSSRPRHAQASLHLHDVDNVDM